VLRVAFAVAVVAAFGVPVGSASGYSVGTPVVASPVTSPFDPCAAQPDQDVDPDAPANFENTSVEPNVAVNPTNGANVIGVFQEDRWFDGGAHGLEAGISQDGGAHYGNNWAAFSACSGNPNEPPRATDPWVSFDAGGRAYQIGLSVENGQLTGPSSVSVSTSTNRGMDWTTPLDIRVVDDPTGVDFLDKEQITADPYRAGHAVAIWIEGNLPGENISINKLAHAFSYRGTPMVSTTFDGGSTWSAPRAMTGMNGYFQGNQAVVEPDGTIVDVFAALFKGSGVQPNGNGVYMGMMRSTNGGKTWSAPTKIAPLRTVGTSADGHPLRVGDYIPDIAVDPSDGNLYVTWADGMGGAPNKIAFVRSTDGGRHWSAPVAVSTHDSVPSFNHAVTVANDGTVAAVWMDTVGNDDATTADGIPTDVYVRSSSDGGRTWGDAQVIDSFDFSKAPDTERGYFLGDYEGLAPIGAHDLLAFIGVAGNDANSALVHSIRLGG
jgi:hypothetical protein